VRTVAVVGASLAGLSTARALRSQGFDGRIVVIGEELHRPYDRPPLSKGFLAGTVAEADLSLEAADEELAVDWRLGTAATRLEPVTRRLQLGDGSALTVDGVVIATGARPLRLAPAAAGPTTGVHVLRTLEDATGLRAELRPGVRLVVVGAGFIGAEVASTARTLGLDVTVVEAARTPLAVPLGQEMGSVLAGLHVDHGVVLRTGVGVTGLLGSDRVTGVQLADGSVVPADVVVVGVGVRPNVEWLHGSGLAMAGGLSCDAYGATALPEVVGVGDCAAWREPDASGHARLEHWTAARERAVVAAATLLSGGSERRRTRPPYFWSDQYGRTIQLAGSTAFSDRVEVIEGSVADRDFLALYYRRDQPSAALALGHGTSFMRWRRKLAAAAAGTGTTADRAAVSTAD
jgi:NADPH-dependent 2,4-dienoyl-CoA reductase/sulfur reductase-like enzyme